MGADCWRPQCGGSGGCGGGGNNHSGARILTKLETRARVERNKWRYLYKLQAESKSAEHCKQCGGLASPRAAVGVGGGGDVGGVGGSTGVGGAAALSSVDVDLEYNNNNNNDSRRALISPDRQQQACRGPR